MHSCVLVKSLAKEIAFNLILSVETTCFARLLCIFTAILRQSLADGEVVVLGNDVNTLATVVHKMLTLDGGCTSHRISCFLLSY